MVPGRIQCRTAAGVQKIISGYDKGLEKRMRSGKTPLYICSASKLPGTSMLFTQQQLGAAERSSVTDFIITQYRHVCKH